MNIMQELKKEERVDSLLNFVISYLNDLCTESPEDNCLRGLKEDIECSLGNYKSDCAGDNDDNEQEADETDLDESNAVDISENAEEVGLINYGDEVSQPEKKDV